MFYIYVLKSLKDERYYIGYTSDLKRRIDDHNRGKVFSTKNRIPFVIVYQEQFDTRLEAQKREKLIKSYKGGDAFKKIIGITRIDPIV